MSVDSAVADVAVICGPTAAGKSAIALWLAEQRGGVIVSADSRQIYRGFDVGTAKPTTEERGHVPHVGVDVVEPTARYSAAAWADAANVWIADALASGRTPLVVGGTGLYLRALFEGLFEEPALDRDRRSALESELGHWPLAELQRWASALDPARAHLGRTQLLRAIEIALLTGRRLSELHAVAARRTRWRPRYLVVDPGATLGERIAARTDSMLDAGWPDEVRRLMQTVPADAPAWKATGYDAVRRLVTGQWSRERARDAIVIATRQYAKRQRTWFRHQLPPDRVTRLNPLDADWREPVRRWLSGAGAAA
ncbi:MAG TPA: tRNA (adenosine(37)-N6)-dimethylallyltransferase MiaA [Gemmatimonadaceae bacterium]|nr:tRNA (adenosine(37)-N6)-dimethylallyltransferase MiaA [Gemmatimonadaceae bacterium]